MKKTLDTKTLVNVLAVIIIAILLLVVIVISYYTGDPTVETIQVERIFIDVDGDNRLDLLLKGEVIFNTDPLAQPTLKP